MESMFSIHATGEIIGLLKPVFSVRAYLDPGSGSFLIQLLIAGLLGGLFLLRTYWKKISTFFSSRFSRTKTNQDEDE